MQYLQPLEAINNKLETFFPRLQSGDCLFGFLPILSIFFQPVSSIICPFIWGNLPVFSVSEPRQATS